MSVPDYVTRTFLLDDIAIRSGGDGRTVDAYAAVWNVEAEIGDVFGHYLERYAPESFDRTLEHIRPQGGRQAWRATVFFNHALTAWGTPSDAFSVPLGTPLDIRRDGYGLLTTVRYNKNDTADRVLESIRNGDIGGYSFRGRIIRSDRRTPKGGFAPDASGRLPVVTRLEMGLTEFGPTPVPAFGEALIVGMRSATPTVDPAEPHDTPDDSGLVAEDSPPEGHSVRHLHNHLRAQARKEGGPLA